jgi:LytR cell envelope-related transcriptional attenuator
VEHAQPIQHAFPWRTATVVVGFVAALELVVLISIGATRLAAPVRAHAIAAAHHAAPIAKDAAPKAAAPVRHVAAPPAHALRPRARLSVLVLNGNGVSGAAGAKAVGLQTLGYGSARSQNAPRHDYARSMVMYVPGFLQEARRLGHDLGVSIVAPVDGMRSSQLSGSQLVVVLGGS